MHVSKSIVSGYCAELASLSYSFNPEKMLQLTISGQDLISFVETYSQEDKTLEFFSPAMIERVKALYSANNASSLYYKILIRFSDVIEGFTNFPVRDIHFSLNYGESVSSELFNDLIKQNKMVSFFETLLECYKNVQEESPELFKKPELNFEGWEFCRNNAILKTKTFEIEINNSVINSLVQRIDEDVKLIGDDTISWLSDVEKRSYKKFNTVKFISDHMEKDILNIIKFGQNLSYQDFVIFFNKYHFGDENGL